jgi:hypothetical protein
MSSLSELVTISGNIAGVVIVIYWIVDTIRNWRGSPELKILKDELRTTNEHIKTLLEKLTE